MFNRAQKAAPPARAQTPKRGVGIVKGNPKRCLRCLNPIRRGEAWTKQTSPDGAYSIIVHDHCNKQG